MKTNLTRDLLKKCEEVSQVMKSLSHPVRLKVFCQLMDGEKTVGELTEFCGISQSAMSQFLMRMRDEGVLQSRKEVTSVYYQITDPRLIKLMRAVRELYCN